MLNDIFSPAAGPDDGAGAAQPAAIRRKTTHKRKTVLPFMSFSFELMIGWR
jgi:hypothetical protein